MTIVELASEGLVDRLVAVAAEVPDSARVYHSTPSDALRRHRINSELLDCLLDHGLTHRIRNGELLFDDYDLRNIALHLGLMSLQRMAFRSWATALIQADQGERLQHRVRYVSTCPHPGHRGRCTFEPLVPAGRVEATRGTDGTIAVVDVVRRTAWPAPTTEQRDLVSGLGSISFWILPEVVRWDLAFLRRTGLSDCGGVAVLLVDDARRSGVPVRFSFGLLVARPYSTPHCWAELLIDDEWVPVDPLLVRALVQWGGLDARRWAPDRSPGALFRRLGDEFCCLAAHRGAWADVSLPTTDPPSAGIRRPSEEAR